MHKKVLKIFACIVLSIGICACDKNINLVDNSGNKLIKKRSELEIIDFSKMSEKNKIKAFHECFSIEYHYVGLPSIVLDDTETTNQLKKSVFGGMYVNDFCKTYSPYILYDYNIKLNNGYAYDIEKNFSVNTLNYFLFGEMYESNDDFGLNDGTTGTLHLSCDEMPKAKTKDAWIKTIDNVYEYKDKIDLTLDSVKNKLTGIDIKSINGKIYKLKKQRD